MPYENKPRQRPWLPKQEARKAQEGRTERTKQYDTQRWRNVRKQHLAQHPLCVECSKEGRTVMSTVLDHIVPYNQGGSFWDATNWQSLCSSHHNRKSAKERHGKA